VNGLTSRFLAALSDADDDLDQIAKILGVRLGAAAILPMISHEARNKNAICMIQETQF
jgi:hypothetical protein